MGTKTTLSLVVIALFSTAFGGCAGSSQHSQTTPGAPSEGAVVYEAEASRSDAPMMNNEYAPAVSTPPMPSSGGDGDYSSAPPPAPPTGGPVRVTADLPTPSTPPPAPPVRRGGEERVSGREPAGPPRQPRPVVSAPTMAPPAEAAPMMEAEEAAPMSASGESDDTSGYSMPAPPMPGAGTFGAPIMRQPQVQVVARLTAASVADVDRRQNYLGYLARHHGETAQFGLDMTRRVRFRVVDGQDRPVHDAAITLVTGGVQVAGRTHADGWWDFFPGISAPQASGPATVYIQYQGSSSQVTVPIPGQGDGRDIVIRLPQAAAVSPTVLDLAFAIDVTGSMGDELRYVNEEVVGIVARVRAAIPQVNVRVGATFYRDRGDYVPLEQIPFSTDINQFVSRMRFVQASGGGDYPEDVNSGLASALTTLQWSQGPAVRVLIVVADAPPQMYPGFPYTYRNAMADASRRGIRILPVAASGSDRSVEYLFRAMGAFTSTPYVYLTDDSGIGGHHMEADTDRVAVEMFSNLLTRLLISDMQGQGMHEPIQDANSSMIAPPN